MTTSDSLHELIVQIAKSMPEDQQVDAVSFVVTGAVKEMTYTLRDEYGMDEHRILEGTRAACREIAENLHCGCHPREESAGSV